MAGITMFGDPLGAYRLPKEEQLVVLGLLEAGRPDRSPDREPPRLQPQTPDELAGALGRFEAFAQSLPPG